MTDAFNTTVAAWHAAWTSKDGANKMAVYDANSAGFAVEAISAAKVCKTDANTSDGGVWTASGISLAAFSDDANGCRKYCETESRTGMLVNPDVSDGNGGTTSRGGLTMAKYAAAPTYCGGFSFKTGGGTDACAIVTGADDPIVADDGNGNETGAAGVCTALKDDSG